MGYSSGDTPAIEGGHPVRTEALPFTRPNVGRAEVEAVTAVLAGGWLTTGPQTSAFEEEFASAVGARCGVALTSCTAAEELALVCLGIGPGDEVITTPYTFTATAEAIIRAGATPVFADVLPDTLTIDPGKVAEAVTEKTKAIVPVHYAGHPCDMDPILEIARRRNLRVVDDAAHAVGALYKGRRIGSLCDCSAFSFHPTKNMTTGEGGMATTNDEEMAARMRRLRLHGISKDTWERYGGGAWYYEVLESGYKYNPPDILSALGRVQLRRLEEFQAGRDRVWAKYDELLAGIDEVIRPTVRPEVRHSRHLYPIRLKLEALRVDRKRIAEALSAEGIGLSVHYLPLHMHKYYAEAFGFSPEDFPVAKDAWERLISLPMYPDLTDSDVEDVAEALGKVIAYYRR